MSQSRLRPFEPGTKVSGKYELLEEIGTGGMGVVFEARHTFVGRRVAVKFLHREFAGDSDLLQRFEREAKTVGSLECENIVSAHDFGIAEDGTPYIVMEYLVGESLRSLLERKTFLPVARITALLYQACHGLSLAHAEGIVHRDIKPENLFVARRSNGLDLLKILDFGIAKLHSAESITDHRSAGTLLGTARYMAPEQIRGLAIGPRADLYSLGAVLYEALSGRFAHPGTDKRGILYHSLQGEIEALDQLRPELPSALCAIVHRALSSDADRRFQTADELADALRPFFEASDASQQAIPNATGELHRDEQETAPGSASPLWARQGRERLIRLKPKRSGFWLWLGTGLVAAALVLVILAEWQVGQDPGRPASDPASLGADAIPEGPTDPAPSVVDDWLRSVPSAASPSREESTGLVVQEDPDFQRAVEPSPTAHPPPGGSDPDDLLESPKANPATPRPSSAAWAPAESVEAEAETRPNGGATRTRRSARGRKREVEFNLSNPYEYSEPESESP